jgi:hypothetical protein
MMHQIDFSDAQSALGFITPAFYNIETTVYQRKYPSFDYASIIPVVTEGSPWGRGVLFRSSDFAGKAEFLSGKAFDMPYADVTRDQFLKGFEMAGIGYEWSREELEVAALEGRTLGDEKATAARGIAEQLLWNVGMTGTTEKNWTGLINDPNVPVATAAATGTGSSPLWSTKTPDQILVDINGAISGVHVTTQETELADTVLLPFSRFNALSTTRIGNDANMTIMKFLMENNSYTAETGRPLTIRSLRALNAAGSGGTARMVVYRKDPEVLRFHLPMPHQFLPPFQKGSMTWEVAGIMRTGGTEIRLPKAVSYIDGI